MLNTVRAVVRDNKKIELLEPVDVPAGTEVLVTILPGSDEAFWLKSSETALKKIWDNKEDDVYEQLLAR